MKYSAVLFSALLFTGSTFAGLLPSGSNTGGNVLPGTGGTGGNVLPGGSTGGNVIPGGSTNGGNILPAPSSSSGGGDFFISPTVLTGASVTDTANNLRATLEPGEPVHGATSGVVGGKSLWWKWKSSVTGVLVISTAGSSIDTVAGVYTGDSVSSLTRVGSDNDSGSAATSIVTVSVVSGLTYYIAVDGYNGVGGDIQLSLNALDYSTTSDGRPSNDDFDTAELLSGNYTTAVGFNDYATPGVNDPIIFFNGENRSVWWEWTAPATGTTTITTDGSSFDTLLAVITLDVFGDSFLEAFDDDGGSTTRSSKVTFDAVKGVTYYISVDGFPYGESAATGTTLLDLSLVPSEDPPDNDQFEYRTGVQSNSNFISATTKDATSVLVEPPHAGSASTATVWWTWTAPSVAGKLTLTATASDITDTINPVIAVYTGSTISTLAPIASATDVGADGTTTLTFDIQPGAVYQIAVAGGALNDSGPFDFTLSYADGSPVFAFQPVSFNAFVGSVASFSAPATSATSNPKYQWQRKVGTTWTNITNGAAYSGADTDTLTVTSVALADTGSVFRCQLYNVLGIVTSSPATLTVVPKAPIDLGGSLNIKVGTVVNTSVAVVEPNFAIKYYALGLPKGLTLNASTGQITGTVTAAAGSYTVTYWTMSNKLKSQIRTTVIVVPPYPTLLTGDFEALLTDGSGLPVGKLQVTIGSTGLYTGKFTSAAAAVNTLKGSMVVNFADTMATASLQIVRKGLETSTLSFTVVDTGTINGTLKVGLTTLGTVVSGVKVATSGIDWAGNYTLAFGAPTKLNLLDGRAIPEGSGYASANIAANGVMTLTGKNADGTPLTASLASDSTASYRLYAKPTTVAGSYVSGWLVLTQRVPITGVYQATSAINNDLYWNLPASTANTTYKAGFGPLGLTARMEPWATLIAPTLQINNLAGTGIFGVNITGAGITNGGANTNQLPTSLQLLLGGQIGLTSANLSAWSITVNTATGVYTGNFTVKDTLTRKVPFSGILLQLPTNGTAVFGQGYFLVPSTAKNGPTLSGAVNFVIP